jgi:hypothetical protein
MNVEELQAAARAKLAANNQTDTFIDPTVEKPIPIIVHRVVPKVDRPTSAAHVLEGFQANFSILVNGRRVMFTNYRFETDDANLAETIIQEYGPRIWRVQ